MSSPDDVDKSTISLAIGLDVTAAPEALADLAKYLSSLAVLADVKLRDQLITAPASGVAIDGDRKAALAIYIARNIAIQPFLLIVRTRHIFTVSTRSVGAIRYE